MVTCIMSLCQRLILTGICARSALFSEGGSVQMNSTKSSSKQCRWTWRLFRFGTSGKTAAKLKGDIVKVMNVRLISTKPNADSATLQSGTLQYLLKWGVMTLLVTTVVSSTVVWWELWSLKRDMSSVTSVLTNSSVESVGLSSLPLTSFNPLSPFLFNAGNNSGGGIDYVVWFPWLQSKSQDPFTLLELCRSKNPAVRKMGVQALAAKTAWEDYQYRYVAQAADYRTLIGLSRMKGADCRFFLHQPALFPKQTPVSEQLASVLLMLDQHQTGGGSVSSSSSSRKGSRGSPPLHSRVAVLAHQHLHHKFRPTDDKIHFWGFDGSSLDVASVDGQLPEDQLLLQFLAAVAQMCCIAEQASLFMRSKGLAVLQRITKQYNNTEIFIAVATVLGSLALHPALHEGIVRAGWLGMLKRWAEERGGDGGEGKNNNNNSSSSSKLAVSAARTLVNMDRDWSTEVLDHGVLILHPFHRSRKTVHADLVFVHGLLGGGVKTWRQQDAAYQSSGPKSGRTDCWPKDWLAEDCPHVRILSVHFDTALSAWSASDTVNRERCTLEGRSAELLEKLLRAGVGQRPIIWVGHSMGGLLIKQMLELCDRDSQHYSPLKQQTSGFLLYSVPHHGLSIAAMTSQVHYLLYPSTEVQELKADSHHLNRLHQHFRQFVQSQGIPCLSFGEELKTVLRKTLPKVLLVPPQSSDPGVGEFFMVRQDHINICKPESQESDLYQQTLSFVHRCIFFSYVQRIRKGVSGSLD